MEHLENVIWLIKTKCGYRYENRNGDYLRFFTMPADSKCMQKTFESNGKKVVNLNIKSSHFWKYQYEIATGKKLWWENN